VVNVGDEIEVKVLRVDVEERKIGLSRKRVDWAEEDAAADASGSTPSVTPSSREPMELKGGVGGESGPLFKSAAASDSND
jgi:small subunit ribosomal protein S1